MTTPERTSSSRDSERGASLMLALIMITVIAVAMVAILSYATTSVHTISVIKDQRRLQYAVDGGVQTAIQAARDNVAAGATDCASLAAMSYAAVAKQPGVTVECQTVQARGPGIPNVNMPPYAIWAVGNGAEIGIDVGKSGGLEVGGSIASNTPGTSIAATTLDVTGYVVQGRGNCTGTIVVSDPADLQCNTGADYGDPGYPSQGLPASTNPNPPPSCAANNAVLQYGPGYYTDVDLFNNPQTSQGGKTCRNGYLYFQPGTYYFDFGFDPAHPGTVWQINSVVVGGEAKNWNPNIANSLPSDISGAEGASVNCKTEKDGAASGVQFVFGGASTVEAASNSTRFEVCASPNPVGTGQQIAIYGQKTGSSPVPASVTRRATSTDPPTPSPVGLWTGLAPTNNLLPIAPNPSSIDGQVASYVIPSQNPGAAGAVKLKGFPGVTVPGGSINVSYALNVAHREIAGNNNDVASVQVQIGTCVIPVPRQRSATQAPPVIDTVTAGCLAAAVAGNFDVTYTATAGNNRTMKADLDGIELVVNYTPPVVEAQTGCHTVVGSACSFLDVGKNKSVFVVWGTVYAPRSKISLDFKNKSVFQFRRGVVVRAIETDAVPPADSSNSFCLGYGSPCAGPSRVLRFTAKTSSGTNLVSLVQFFDSPSLGHTVSVLAWNQLKS